MLFPFIQILSVFDKQTICPRESAIFSLLTKYCQSILSRSFIILFDNTSVHIQPTPPSLPIKFLPPFTFAFPSFLPTFFQLLLSPLVIMWSNTLWCHKFVSVRFQFNTCNNCRMDTLTAHLSDYKMSIRQLQSTRNSFM